MMDNNSRDHGLMSGLSPAATRALLTRDRSAPLTEIIPTRYRRYTDVMPNRVFAAFSVR
jgi:hypothetical protein